jgi:hypothetical protein
LLPLVAAALYPGTPPAPTVTVFTTPVVIYELEVYVNPPAPPPPPVDEPPAPPPATIK